MDAAIHRQRHAQRWEAAETNARRVAIGGVIFAVLILLNVVEPYFEVDEQRKLLPDLRTQLQSLRDQKQALEARRDALSEIKAALDNVNKAVESAPWTKEVEDLIKDCEKNCSQQVADKTVERIASLMRAQTVEPLRQAISQTRHEIRVRERGDPLLSTPWTLTWRGAAGGAITIVSYGAALGVLIYCIYRSANPGHTDVLLASAEAQIVPDQPVELAMALLALALVAAGVFTLRRDK